MANEGRIDLAGLPRKPAGNLDAIAGVDTATNRAALFPVTALPMPQGVVAAIQQQNATIEAIRGSQGSGLPSYATRAALPAPGTLPRPSGGGDPLVTVTNDPTAANNGAWRDTGSEWVQSADRVTGLEGRVGEAEQWVDELDPVTELLVSKNLYNPSERRVNKYINTSSGSIGDNPGWAITGFIPITPGQQYTISANANKRAGAAFYSAKQDVGALVGTVNVGTVNATTSATVTAPAGSAYLVVALESSTIPEPSQVQIEAGSVRTDFEPYFAPYRVVAAGGVPAHEVRLDKAEDRIATVEADLDALPARRNLYDTTAQQSGRYVNATNGGLSFDAAWSASDYIPVTPGKQYTISANGEKRAGLAFYDSGFEYVPGSYDGTPINATESLTVTAPTGAAYLVINVKSNTVSEPSEVQVERGAEKTAYLPFGEVALVSEVGVGSTYVELATTTARVVASRNGDTIERVVEPWPVRALDVSPVFNPVADRIGGVTIKSSTDDAAPYRALDTTIGANHGYQLTELTAAAHGKTASDVGSVWDNGGVQYVLLGVRSASVLQFAARLSNGAAPTGSYTHVSGATNTAGFTANSATGGLQWYAATVNRECRVFADGVEIVDLAASVAYRDSVQFQETYDVLDRQVAIDWFIANPGTTSVEAVGAPAFSVTLVHSFDVDGNYTIFADFIARRDGVSLSDIMFTQAQRMNITGDGAIQYYVPKALPFTHEGTPYDWAMIDSSDTTGWATRADFTPARCEPTGILADRMVMLSDSYGFAIGYAPVQDAEPAARRLNATVKALQISNSNGKVYPSCINKGAHLMARGDTYKAVAYRNVFKRDPSRTDSYVVRMKGRAFIYADWHNATKVDRVPVPADLVGRPFTVVEARNAALMSESLTTGVLVDVAATGSYAYLIVEVA